MFRCPLFLILLALLARTAPGAIAFFPLEEVRAGMHGVGKTVFAGGLVEEFQVEILGVLPNAGPKESVVLARLSGGPLEHTGVLQGMSGSPVYIDGKLLGAVALAFPFSKDPIAAIRPIADMIRVGSAAPFHEPPAHRRLADVQMLPAAADATASRLINISTPLALGGFTQRTIDAFAPQLQALGLEPRQGLSAGGAALSTNNAVFGNPRDVPAGSMISVQLMQGDLNMGADGTVTYVDGDRLYAFGHRFMAVGSTGMPFARAEVLTLLANVNTSFKVSAPHELMGMISQDRDAAIAGRFGQRANMLPLDIAVRRSGKLLDTYRINMVNDPSLTPLLLQMAIFSTLDSTERSSGPSTIAVRGTVELSGNRTIQLNDVYAADAAALQVAALSTATPVAYVLQSGFDSLQVKHIGLEVEAIEKKKILEIAEVLPSRRETRPGDTVELAVMLTGANGEEETHTARYAIPVGAPAGPLYFTVADGPQTSLQELRFALTAEPRTPEQLLSMISRLRNNDKAYVRVWRAETAFPAGVEELPSPPPSVVLVMSSSLGASATLNTAKNSKIAEMTIDAGGRMVTGSKTVSVEVKP